MDPVTIAVALSQLAPQLVKWFVGSDKSVAVAEKAVAVAKAVTGKGSGQEALEALQANPELVLKYQEAVLDHEHDFESIQLEAAKAVNTTMQVEAAAEHWPTYSWRPFIGFNFGCYVGAQWVLPLFHLPQPTIDAQLMLVVGSILGIASFFRGKAQADPGVVTPQMTQKG